MAAVTQAARRRMIRTVRAALARNLTGGELWFAPDGSGGAWYSSSSMPPDPARTIIVRLEPGADPAELVDSAAEQWEAAQT